MYIVSVIMYILFQNSTLNIFAGRGALYYSISVIILIPYILKYLFQNVIFDIVYWSIFFLLYLWIMEKDINGYAINLGIDIFRPYYNVLFPDGLF